VTIWAKTITLRRSRVSASMPPIAVPMRDGDELCQTEQPDLDGRVPAQEEHLEWDRRLSELGREVQGELPALRRRNSR